MFQSFQISSCYVLVVLKYLGLFSYKRSQAKSKLTGNQTLAVMM